MSWTQKLPLLGHKCERVYLLRDERQDAPTPYLVPNFLLRRHFARPSAQNVGHPQLCTPPHYMRNARTTNGTLICNAPEIATCCGEAAPVQPHHHSLPKFQVTKIAFLPLGSHTFQAIWHKVWDWPSTGSSTVSKDYSICVLTPWLHFHILSYTRWFLKLDSCSTWFGCPSHHPGLNVPSPALVKSI